MSEFKKMCVATNGNMELMRLMQDKAFELGYEWGSVGKSHKYLDADGLHFYQDGSLAYGEVGDVEDREILKPKQLLALSKKDVLIERKYPLRVKGPDYDD